MEFSIHYSIVIDGVSVDSQEDVLRVLRQLKGQLDGELGRYKAWGEEEYGQKWSAKVVSATLVPSLRDGGD